MNGDELIKIIGKPISDLSVQNMLKHFGYKEPEKGYYAGRIYGDEISIAFSSRCVFETTYSQPPYEFANATYIETPFEKPDIRQLEFIVSEIRFSEKFTNRLPFNLKWNDTIEKLKKFGKSNGKSENSEGTKIWYFLKDEYRIQLAIDKTDKLKWITVWLIDNGIKKSLKLKETIRIQNKNILAENNVLVSEFKNKKPTIQWYKDLRKKDSFYTKESVDETDKVLSQFIENLVIATKEKKANKVLSSVKKVVLALNKLEEKFAHIETDEREDLCLFILDAVENTGFQCDYDLTEEWRNW